MSFIRDIIQLFTDEFLDRIKHVLEGYANRILRRVLRILILGVIGITFVGVGFVFILISMVTYLSQMMTSWLAWGIVGFIAALVGGILLLFLRV